MFWKMCRVPDVHAARLGATAGAKYVGVHAMRRLSQARAQAFARIVREMREYYPSTRVVLLTCRLSAKAIAGFLRKTGIDIVQFHRRMLCEELSAIDRRLAEATDRKIDFVPVFSSDSLTSLTAAAGFARCRAPIPFCIIDKNWRGGTGEVSTNTKNTERLIRLLRPLPVLLAGGISPDNVQEYARLRGISGFDVQSRLEINRRGRPKDPSKVFTFARKIGVANAGFPALPRRSVALGLGGVSTDRAREAIRRLRRTDIDVLHIDHSDGTSMPGFQSDSMVYLKHARRYAPTIPCDIHIYTESMYTFGDVLRSSLDTNPYIRIALLHINRFRKDTIKTIALANDICRKLRTGFGISVHTMSISAKSCNNLFAIASRFKFDQVSFLLPSRRHNNSVVLSRLTPLLGALEEQTRRNHFEVPCVSLDRDVTTERLKLFDAGRFSQVIVGRALLESDRPQRMIRELRQHLGMPRL